MGSKKTYQGIRIKVLDHVRLLAQVSEPVLVSIDVAKAAFAAAIVLATGEVLRIVRFEHPTETRVFLELLQLIKDKARELTVLMEPTGTYGDSLRYQLGLRGFAVRMVQPKRTHDAREVFDGVPSKHDNKDAVTLARLHVSGASSEWRPLDEQRRAMRAVFDQYYGHARAAETLFGQIEARLARHWPELEQWLSVRRHASARALLEQYGTPQQVAEQADQARATLRRASRGQLAPELIEGVVDAARSTLGIPMLAEEEALLKDQLGQLSTHLDVCDRMETQIETLMGKDAAFARMRPAVGTMAAAAAITYLGQPGKYSCSRAWLKAAGLNMFEISSGTHKGEVKITKRGPSVVRQLLYMAALRAIDHDPIVTAWYRGRKAYGQDRKNAAVVAVMRKLHAAQFYVGKHDVEYDSSKLFDVRRLTFEDPATNTRSRAMPPPRTVPRSTARRAGRASKEGGARA